MNRRKASNAYGIILNFLAIMINLKSRCKHENRNVASKGLRESRKICSLPSM